VTNLPSATPVKLRVARASKVIGMPLSVDQCVTALNRLRLPLSEEAGVITVTPPSYRFDLKIEEDLIEEVARMVGYNQLPYTPPVAPITARLGPESRRSTFAVRRSLADLGYQETINFSFVDQRWEHELAGSLNPIKLLNPIASQMSVMRSSLLGSLVQVLQFNLARKAGRVRIFEVGRVFLRDPSVQNTDSTVEGFDQPLRVSGLASGPRDILQWGRKDDEVDFFDVKGDIESLLAPRKVDFLTGEHPAMHPGRCAQVVLNGKQIGYVGELHPKWRLAYDLPSAPTVFELELTPVLERAVPQFQAVDRFQAVQRDIAMVVADSVSHAEIMAAVWGAPAEGLLRDATLFDVYRPKVDRNATDAPTSVDRSVAVRLTLNGLTVTLTDEQIDSAVKAIVAALENRLGARQRT
jgi:phenylalanyl-tRNA synthetase beta chain